MSGISDTVFEETEISESSEFLTDAMTDIVKHIPTEKPP